MNSFPTIGWPPLNLPPLQNNLDLSQILSRHHQLLSQSLRSQILENSKLQSVEISALLTQNACNWQQSINQTLFQFQENILTRMAHFENLITSYFQNQKEQLEQQYSSLNGSVYEKTCPLKAEKQTTCIQRFEDSLTSMSSNKQNNQTDATFSSSFQTDEDFIFDLSNPLENQTPNRDEIANDAKYSDFMPPTMPDSSLTETFNPHVRLTSPNANSSTQLSKSSRQSTPASNGVSKENSPLIKQKKLSKTEKKNFKKSKKAAKNVSIAAVKDKMTFPSTSSTIELEIPVLNDALNTISSSEVTKENSPLIEQKKLSKTGKKNLKKSKKAAKNVSIAAVKDKMIFPSTSSTIELEIPVLNDALNTISSSEVTKENSPLIKQKKLSKTEKKNLKKSKKAAKNVSIVAVKDKMTFPSTSSPIELKIPVLNDALNTTSSSIKPEISFLNDAHNTTSSSIEPEISFLNDVDSKTSSLHKSTHNDTYSSKLEVKEESKAQVEEDLEIQKSSLQCVSSDFCSNSFAEPKSLFIDVNVLSNAINASKVHVNVLYHRIQLMSSYFQSIGQLLLFLEKSNEFLLTDCWVEKK